MNKVTGIAGLVILAVIGLLIYLYGDARESVGGSNCTVSNVVAGQEGAKESQKNLEKTQRETHFMSDTDVDADLYRLGIMRSESDY